VEHARPTKSVNAISQVIISWLSSLDSAILYQSSIKIKIYLNHEKILIGSIISNMFELYIDLLCTFAYNIRVKIFRLRYILFCHIVTILYI